MEKKYFRIVLRNSAGEERDATYVMQTYAHDTDTVFTGEVESFIKRTYPMQLGDTVTVEETEDRVWG